MWRIYKELVVLMVAVVFIELSTIGSATRQNGSRTSIWIPIPSITVPPTTPVVLTADTISFLDTFTHLQNMYRSLHGAAPLARNDQLAARAQTCADGYLAQYPDPVFPIPPALPPALTPCGVDGEIRDYRDRISVTGGANAKFIGDSWYAVEQPLVVPPAVPPYTGAEHFTQMVWQASTEYGCAISFNAATAVTSAWYVSCIYSPAGNNNQNGGYAANVVPAPLA